MQGSVRGCVDVLNHFEVIGFSWIGDNRYDHVMITVNGVEVATVPANRFRKDLREAGVGDGRSAFKFVFAETSGIFKPIEIGVWSKETGKHLTNGKKTLPPLLDGGGTYRHSLAQSCVAFVPLSMAREKNRIKVITRAIWPLHGEPVVSAIACSEESQAQPQIDDLKIVSTRREDLPEGASHFYAISWSFDVNSCGESTFVLFRLCGADRQGALAEDSLSDIVSTVCVPLKTSWFTEPPVENYTRTSGPVTGNQLTLVATTAAYKVDAISKLMFRGRRDIAVLDWGAGFGRVAMPLKRVFNRDARIIGCDIDQFNVDWAKNNIQDIRIDRCDLYPPILLPSESLDFVFAISVMTHLTETAQEIWLRELRRLVKPGGIVLLTVRGDHLVVEQQLRSPEVLKQLARSGISDIMLDDVNLKLENKTYYRGTVQLRQHVEQHWSRHFEIVAYLPYVSLQDWVLMRKT
jgi:SAM-dependent methyltransferase